jgi:diketogulonate reductase-like aldo/keto reductase/sugar-specific transcriptional regulator TrmB
MENLLQQLGLTENETKVYLAFLKNGEKVAAEISRILKMDKSSCYRAVETLISKSLLIPNPKTRGTTYLAANPEVLKELITNKKIELETQFHSLNSFIEKIKNFATNQRVTYFTIEKGLQAHISCMEDSINNNPEKIIREKFRSSNPLFRNKEYQQYIFSHYLKKRIKNHVVNRQLQDLSIKDSYFEIETTSKKLLKELRILPSDFTDNTEFRIYNNTVEIINFDEKKEFTIIKITDEYISQLVKDMFDYIWKRSAVYYKDAILPQKEIAPQVNVPVIGIGTWGIGGFLTKNPYNDNINDVDQIRHSLSLGQTMIDTSILYASGFSLGLISKAIKNFPRENLFIVSKLDYFVRNKIDVEKQCDRYLKALNIDYIDLFEIHAPPALKISITETVHEMDKLIDKGKVKYLGVSNFNIKQLQEAEQATKYRIVAHEIHYNLVIRANEENGVIDYCNKNNILLICFQPLRRGQLSDLDTDPLIGKLCKKYGKTPGQIAINWLISKPNIVIFNKSTNGSHINENVASAGWRMDDEDYIKLNKWRLPGYKTPIYDKSGVGKTGIKIWKL